MVCDDADRSPARAKQPGNAADQAFQLLFDLPGKRRCAVVMAVPVDFARL